MFNWFKPQEKLTPGTCECEHERCCHKDGKGRCYAAFPPDAEWPNGATCACQIYIEDKDDGGDDTPSPTDPQVEELSRMHKL